MIEVIARHAVVGSLFFLPFSRRKSVERWLRGREEHRKLQQADWLLVSWGKSGRTWLRVMLSRVYEQKYGLDRHDLVEFDNLHRKNPEIPKVFFTHGNYLRNYTGHGYDTKVDYYGKRTVLLVRDPRDVAVSQYFQWKYRMRPHKKRINDYPSHNSEIEIFDFLMEPEQGLPRVIRYFNSWLKEIPNVGDVLVVRYEDMRESPGEVLKQILEFTGTPATDEQIADAVEFAAYENLKKKEGETKFSPFKGGWRLVPGNRNNPNSFKVRRAKVGGYRDYFTDEQLARIDAIVDEEMLPLIGYTSSEAKRVREDTAGAQNPA